MVNSRFMPIVVVLFRQAGMEFLWRAE